MFHKQSLKLSEKNFLIFFAFFSSYRNIFQTQISKYLPRKLSGYFAVERFYSFNTRNVSKNSQTAQKRLKVQFFYVQLTCVVLIYFWCKTLFSLIKIGHYLPDLFGFDCFETYNSQKISKIVVKWHEKLHKQECFCTFGHFFCQIKARNQKPAFIPSKRLLDNNFNCCWTVS